MQANLRYEGESTICTHIFRFVGKLKDTFLVYTQGEYLEHSSLINLANRSLPPARIIFIAASAPMSERSVKLRKLSDSQVPTFTAIPL